MENTQISTFQYSTPKITKFNYIANIQSEDKECVLKLKHRKHIDRDSENHAVVILELLIGSADDTLSPFELELKIESEFIWNDMSEDTLSTMLNQNAPSLLVGFARPIISNFTNNSGFVPFNLPLINFTQDPIHDIAIKRDN